MTDNRLYLTEDVSNVLTEIYFRSAVAVKDKPLTAWKEILLPFYDEIKEKIPNGTISFEKASELDFIYLQTSGYHWWPAFDHPRQSETISDIDGNKAKVLRHGLLTLELKWQD